MKRTLVIGDIHGGFKALQQVFERANITENDQLIFLGDYVDRGRQNLETICLFFCYKVSPSLIYRCKYSILLGKISRKFFFITW